jgi:predicted ribonuclease YlaK
LGHRRKLIIFVNPTKVRGSEELGFYSGDRIDKLLQNSIGAVLSSKLGDSVMVDILLQQNKIEIFPISDIRGYEVHKDDILYITEAQNLSTDLIKLVIQRCSEGSKVILEGDPETQLDSWAFEGKNNGLRRVIEIFTGFSGFGHVNLPIIRRSKLAAKAEEL